MRTQSRRAHSAAISGRVYVLLLVTGVAGLFPLLLLLPLPLVRVPLGLGLVLLAPGYALTEVIFSRRRNLDAPARAALSFGLSVVTLPLLALGLNMLPWGLSVWPMALSLSGWVILLCGLAIWRQQAVGAEASTAPATSRKPWSGAAKLGAGIGVLALVVALLAAGSALIAAGTSSQPTEFYVLGARGVSADYPYHAMPGEQLTATIGIVNGEPDARAYQIEVWAVDRRDPRQRALTGRAGPLMLEPGQLLEQPISWRMPWPGDDQAAELLLFTEGSPEPYRRLRLSIAVGEAAR
jgi:uncharacterized membrane protein